MANNLDLLVLASAMAVSEGFFAPDGPNGPVTPKRCNNPGDLVFAGQDGAVPDPVSKAAGRTIPFAKFDSPQRGTCALLRQLCAYAQRGLSLRQMYTAFSPSSDGNNTELLISEAIRRVQTASGLTIDPNVPLWNYLNLTNIP